MCNGKCTCKIPIKQFLEARDKALEACAARLVEQFPDYATLIPKDSSTCRVKETPAAKLIPPDGDVLINAMRLKYLEASDECLERLINTLILPLLWSRGFSLIRTPTEPIQSESDLEPVLSIGPSGLHGEYQQEL